MGNPYNAAVTAETAAGIAINSVIFEVIKISGRDWQKRILSIPAFYDEFVLQLFT